MNALAQSIAEYRDAARQFSRPARLFLLSTSLTWMAHGLSSVLFNLYLIQGGFRESFEFQQGICLIEWGPAR